MKTDSEADYEYDIYDDICNPNFGLEEKAMAKMLIKDEDKMGENMSALSMNQGSRENGANDGPTLSEQNSNLEFNERDLKASSEL